MNREHGIRLISPPRLRLHESVGAVRYTAHIVVRNPHAPDPGSRRLLIGRTDGHRGLTLVIERTLEPTTWLAITGWGFTNVERKLLRSD